MPFPLFYGNLSNNIKVWYQCLSKPELMLAVVVIMTVRSRSPSRFHILSTTSETPLLNDWNVLDPNCQIFEVPYSELQPSHYCNGVNGGAFLFLIIGCLKYFVS